jgi:DNA polymerase III subunit delta'
MGFSDIIGHEKPLTTLRSALTNRTLHHAYLWVGPAGVGKRTVALGLAKAIHCREIDGDFCGVCADCDRIENGNHPDVRVVGLAANKKEISIHQIREIEKELSFRAFTGKKIIIIDPASLMNIIAQNALLKTLEEPPPESLIVLLTTKVGALLPTLRSRCLRLSFAALPRDAVAAFLGQKRNIPRDRAEALAALSMGSLGDALELDQPEWLEQRRRWIDIVRSLRPGDMRPPLAAAEALAGDREQTLRFIAWVESWYRDLLIYKAAQAEDEVINADLHADISKLAAPADIKKLLAALTQAAGAAARVQRNLNRRMVLEQLLLEAAEAAHG